MLLGLDLGTTNIKALLVDEDGAIASQGSAPVPLHHVAGDGVEQNIEEIWQATLAAIRQAGSGGLAAVRARPAAGTPRFLVKTAPSTGVRLADVKHRHTAHQF